MEQRIAVVTGASRGIGLATAQRLVERGLRVVGVARSGAVSPGFDLREGDVSERESLGRALGDLERVDAVVAAAGICRQAALDDGDADDVWREVLDVNLNGAWNTLRVLSGSLTRGAGIVAVSSGLGKLGRANYAAYAASKHGVLGLVRSLARELSPRGIRVNAVCPGWVDTEMAREDVLRTAKRESATPEEIERRALAGIPLGRFVRAEEVAALIEFLLGESASAITGEAFNVSAGEFGL